MRAAPDCCERKPFVSVPWVVKLEWLHASGGLRHCGVSGTSLSAAGWLCLESPWCKGELRAATEAVDTTLLLFLLPVSVYPSSSLASLPAALRQHHCPSQVHRHGYQHNLLQSGQTIILPLPLPSSLTRFCSPLSAFLPAALPLPSTQLWLPAQATAG